MTALSRLLPQTPFKPFSPLQAKSLSLTSIILCLALSLTAMPSHAFLPSADSQGNRLPSLAPLVKQTQAAVVNISVTSTQTVNNPLLNDPFFRRFFNVPKNYSQQRQASSAGSGVIIDAKQGTVITNYHVIKNADEIQIGLSDGRQIEAELVGSDPDVDIAVLRIKAKDLQALPLADSSLLEVGDFAIAIGNPFGLNHTVTTGIVSALERSGLGIEGYENFIQTDASINPGNSGGALINLRGELIGINTAILAPSGGNVGIGFAIPSNMAKHSIEQILQHGEVKRGRLGIYIQALTPALAEAFNTDKDQQGVLITKVEEDSPAADAGLAAEDIIIAIDGKTVKNPQELRNIIGLAKLNSKVEVSFLRNGKEKSKRVKIKSYEPEQTAKQSLPEKLQGASFSQTDKGLQVSQIAPSSPASESGLRVGDLIIEVNHQSISSLADLSQVANTSQLLVRIIRQNAVFYIVVR